MNRRASADVLLAVGCYTRAESLALLRALVTETAIGSGCSETLTRKLVLAVDEACANVIRHAYNGDPRGRFELYVLREGRRLIFRLRDYAARADPARVKPKRPARSRPGGLGIHFINEIMDSWKLTAPLESDGSLPGNLLIMTRRIE